MADALLDTPLDFGDMGLFNFNAFDTDQSTPLDPPVKPDRVQAIENELRLPLNRKPGEVEADQNEWMKVFVPSLLLAGFPRQIPTSEMPVLVPSTNHQQSVTQPPLPVRATTPLPTLSHTVDTFSMHLSHPIQPPPFSMNAFPGVMSTSPPLTLSTLQYPFQSLDLCPPAYITGQVQSIPPTTASFPGMEYLIFPETPGLPVSQQEQQQMIQAEMARMAAAVPVDPTPAVQEQVERAIGSDAWDIFRTPSRGSAEQEVAGGMKRKRGRPKCSFAQAQPTAHSISNDTLTTVPVLPNVMLLSPQHIQEQRIETQDALEAELKAAVDELDGRLRGILDRTAPNVKLESGVSDAVNGSGGEWNVASAIISRVMTDSPKPPTLPVLRRSEEPLERHGTPLNRIASPSPSPPILKGSWMPEEIQRLREIVKVSQEEVDGEVLVNWNIVSERFGPNRTKHQILCKAVELGLKSTTTAVNRRKRQKRHLSVLSGLESTSRCSSGGASGEGAEIGEGIRTCTTATSVSSS